MRKTYSEKDINTYALNYAIYRIRGGFDIFKDYKKHTQYLNVIKNQCSEEKIYTFNYLNDVCTKYGNESIFDDLIFDDWYSIYLRQHKIKKITDNIKQKPKIEYL